ncbi:transglutaminase-like domain-containing protein [Arenicella xantha]|uniref:transglutaminase-like domain-containing protein n=1 Tax=Arenicella xantha TaxID=644221 RepID=UPI00147462C9|nr:transglutaminase family protein [Arenicella xantha]
MKNGLLKNSFALLIICLIALAYLEQTRHVVVQRGGGDGASSLPHLSTVEPLAQNKQQRGFITSQFGMSHFNTDELNAIVGAPDYQAGNDSFYLTDPKHRIINYVAVGINQKPYFANSYLVGFVPFQTDRIWVPLATLSMRKRYVLDHIQYGPSMSDVWQNSEQAYYYGHGDCEDHALLLADWLIGLDYDARVVIGEIPAGGHAWVVVFLDGKEYVLEATDKRRPSSLNDFMLASLATAYRPKLQFNRTSFWENTGSTLTVRYGDDKWQLHSRFKRESPAPLTLVE